MQKLLAKLAKGRKAIVAAATQVGAAVVLIAPDTSSDVKVGLGILAAVISLALVYRVPNRREPSADLGRARVGVGVGKGAKR